MAFITSIHEVSFIHTNITYTHPVFLESSPHTHMLTCARAHTLTRHSKMETGQCDELTAAGAIILLSPVPAILPACHSQLEFKNYREREKERLLCGALCTTK